VLLQPASAGQFARAGKIQLDGDQSALASLAVLIDTFDPNFNIVTP
jgi:alkyl sulfatase BDS1-like metallo-beta-lactamase superfamily hydrolase